MKLSVTQRVENILKYDPASRNSDKRLLVVYWQKAGMNLSEAQIKRFMELPSSETIRRTRQVLQEQGKYPASEAVNEARFKKFRQVRANIIGEPPEKLLERPGYHIRDWKERG